MHDGLAAAASIPLGNSSGDGHDCPDTCKKYVGNRFMYGGVALLPDVYVGAIVIKKEGQGDEQWSISKEMPLLLELKDFLKYFQNDCQLRCGFDTAAAGVSCTNFSERSSF